METNRKNVLVNIYRPQLKKFLKVRVEVTKGTTILDVLKFIKRNIDGSLSFRYQCEMGSCGSCGVVVNGRPVLACQTEILSLKKEKLVIRPLYNFPVIKDLVVDQDSLMFERYYKNMPLIKINCDIEEIVNPSGEFIVSPSILELVSVYARCINCGLCMSACPTVSSNKDFLGPYILLNIYRYYLDPRINLKERLLERVTNREVGITSCHYIRSCTKVCPENIEVAECIQKLKKEYFKRIIIPVKLEKLEIYPRAFIVRQSIQKLQSERQEDKKGD